MVQNDNPLWRHQIDRHDILQGSHTITQEVCQCETTAQVRNVEIICHNKDENDYDLRIGDQNITKLEKISNHMIHDIVIESESNAQQQMQNESSIQVRPRKETGYDTVDREVSKMMRSHRKITMKDRHFSKFDQMNEHEKAVEDLVDGKQQQLHESTSFEFQNFSSPGQSKEHEVDTNAHQYAAKQLQLDYNSHLQRSQTTSQHELNCQNNVQRLLSNN